MTLVTTFQHQALRQHTRSNTHIAVRAAIVETFGTASRLLELPPIQARPNMRYWRSLITNPQFAESVRVGLLTVSIRGDSVRAKD